MFDYHLAFPFSDQFFDCHGPRPALPLTGLHDMFVGSLGQVLTTLNVGAATGEAIGNCLFARMADRDLHYHTPVHILAMFHFAHKHGIPLALEDHLAIWFHDAIYDPRSRTNETESVAFFGVLLRNHLLPQVRTGVRRRIMATAQHLQVTVRDADVVGTMMDLDVSNFAYPKESHLACNQAVAAEYNSICSAGIYREGRDAFLQAFAAKGFIFRTPLFRQRFEAAALAALRADLDT